jgi:NitT/TauT family transport system permease protein
VAENRKVPPFSAVQQQTARPSDRFLPVGVLLAGLVVWWAVAAAKLFPPATFPSPPAVVNAFGQEVRSGRMTDDLVASLFRVTIGFLIAVALSVPLGLLMGHHVRVRIALLPFVNFFRNLSPLAWIPFAVLWFRQTGDVPAIFLIFLASFFPTTLAVMAAVANIPTVYFRVGRDYGLSGVKMLTSITLPAIMPQFITTLRVNAGIAWMVVVAAEMLAGKDGLGFAIWDSRNGLRTDILVCEMIVIGLIGVAIDRLLVRLTFLPSVRWGYER